MWSEQSGLYERVGGFVRSAREGTRVELAVMEGSSMRLMGARRRLDAAQGCIHITGAGEDLFLRATDICSVDAFAEDDPSFPSLISDWLLRRERERLTRLVYRNHGGRQELYMLEETPEARDILVALARKLRQRAALKAECAEAIRRAEAPHGARARA